MENPVGFFCDNKHSTSLRNEMIKSVYMLLFIVDVRVLEFLWANFVIFVKQLNANT